MRIKLILSYDGTNFYGYEHQVNKRNVEDELLKTIQMFDPKVKKTYASGRTDRFVHAKGQVVHFDSDMFEEKYKWMLVLNSKLPEDIYVVRSEIVSDDFHARYSAKSKTYRYRIVKQYDVCSRNYADFIPHLDMNLLKECMDKMKGTHDFKGFASAEIHPLKNTVKTISEAKIIETEDEINLIFTADGFLKHQVRKMVGTIVRIALGREISTIIDKIFETKDPRLTNHVMSGHGLYLEEVFY